MATFEEFKKNENTLYTKIYRDTLKDSISSFLDSQDRKIAPALRDYISQLSYIYGEHLLKDVVFSGEMVSKNIEKKIERSLASIKTVNPETGMPEQKFYSIMELCKYPLDLLKANAKTEGYDVQKAVEDAISDLKPLVDNYYEGHDQKNQQFNWDGYVNAYHNILNKYIDQASRGNNFDGLAISLGKLNSIKDFADNDKKFEVLNEVRKAYNNSTNFSGTATTKESTGTYKLDVKKVRNSLILTQMFLRNMANYMPNGQEKVDVNSQIDYIERLIDVIVFNKSEDESSVVKFFLNTDREDMVTQLLKNVNKDWDIISKLSNNQCKKIMNNVDNFKSSKAYLATKAALGQYIRENYEKYVSAEALKNPNILAGEMIKLSKSCEQKSVSQILNFGPGIPDTALRYVLEDIQQDKNIDVVDVIPNDLQKQIVQSMSNNKLTNNRVLFNSWKYSTDKFIAVTEIIDRMNNVNEDFQKDNSIPKEVALSILWENILGLNRLDYYIEDEASSNEIANMIEELETDGIYADWSDKTVEGKLWEGRSFEKELERVEGIYNKYATKLSEDEEVEEIKK